MASPFRASADSLALLSETDRRVEHDDGQDRDRFDARPSQEGSMSLSLKSDILTKKKRRHRASVASHLIRVRRRNVELGRHPPSDGGALHSPTSWS